MISLILPYWKRQAAADKALAMLDAIYFGRDVEVIVVDDGDPDPFIEPRTSLDLKVLRLPRKDAPKSPVTCWNEGVKVARRTVAKYREALGLASSSERRQALARARA